MFRPVWMIFLLLCFAACKNDDKKKETQTKTEAPQIGLASFFKEGALPYQLSDTALLRNSDTASLPASIVAPLIADSIKKKYFDEDKIRYTALARFAQKGKDVYYIIKASGGGKKAALLLVFDKQNNFGATYPLLLPDANPNTSQTVVMDKNFTVTKTTTLRNGAEVTGEGKEVVAYDAASKAFSLIMMDALNDNPAVLVNPIDTFPKKNKLAGDYFLNKKNLIAVRDGRYPTQLLVYIHTENEAGDCIGQLKGEFILTTSTTAAYRQGGDPCVLNLTFNGNTVSMSEERGCGNYRGLDCPLSGSFTRKKAQSAKPLSSKTKRR
ncbi:hypothetical protein [Flavisolibacter ginsenosidimutans]|uniref:Uncharacterized protein n=1 Tax=Flavisolibacter ginsenosidimutans TaxID=661481 RepID=A0A5B8UI91_9BACT|nr:hypothetical protein [Flavisolibacter ginsenosidimutans]QEC56374.1 hypothetical protein FSB75_10890 [Flavisolibacter ginsenosidimutans]